MNVGERKSAVPPQGWTARQYILEAGPIGIFAPLGRINSREKQMKRGAATLIASRFVRIY